MNILQANLGAISSDINNIIAAASAKYGVSSDLITSVVQKESNGNPNAVSSAGAQGLMQLMPATASSLGVSNPFDPTQNIDAGTRYLASLISKYNGDVSTALAAYNFGPGNVDSGKSWPKETINYVTSIVGSITDGFGFTNSLSQTNNTPDVNSNPDQFQYDTSNIFAMDSTTFILAGLGITALLLLLI